MTMFGLTESTVAQAVRAVSRGDVTRDEIEDRFARAAWSVLAEPGDGVAGDLIDALGAPEALQVVIDGVRASAVAARTRTAVSPDDAAAGLERWTPRLSPERVMVALRQAARFGAGLRVPGDEAWPASVADLGRHAPVALWVRGEQSALTGLGTSIALVGARAATGYGEHVAMEASAGLVDRGYAIVSGAAYGIDGMAHRAALASGGLTVAFLAGGVDRFYPSGHDALLTRIVERGAVVSEVPCGTPPTKWRFLQRNRLIAATSLATVVLEAGVRSGSLNTAKHARDLGRPMGAVPGPVTSAASAGCHRLLRGGFATCVTSAAEMAELAPLPGAPSPASGPFSPEETRVLDSLSDRSFRDVDEIAVRSGLSATDVRAELGRLAIENLVIESDRGWRKRRGR